MEAGGLNLGQRWAQGCQFNGGQPSQKEQIRRKWKGPSKDLANYDFCEGAMEDAMLKKFLGRPSVKVVPHFHPKEEEFRNPFQYLRKLESLAGHCGICKITPPESFRQDTLTTDEFLSRLSEHEFFVTEQRLFQPPWTQIDESTTSRGKERVPAQSFKDRSASLAVEFGLEGLRNNAECEESDVEAIEDKYWKTCMGSPSARGFRDTAEQSSRVSGTMFGESHPIASSSWNPKSLRQQRDALSKHLGDEPSKIFDPQVRLGCTFGTEFWRCRPVDLLGLDFLHGGAPRVLYACPPPYNNAVEELIIRQVFRKAMGKLFREGKSWERARRKAYLALARDSAMVIPKRLTDEGIPLYRAIHRPGEIMVLFPRSRHMSFSLGLNCQESVNVAPVDWFFYGARALMQSQKFGRPPPIPVEEMLCKDAILLGLLLSTGHQPPESCMALIRTMLIFVREHNALERQLTARFVRRGHLNGDDQSGKCSNCGTLSFLSMVGHPEESAAVCLRCACNIGMFSSDEAVLFCKPLVAELKCMCNYFRKFVDTNRQTSTDILDFTPRSGYLNTLDNPLVLAHQTSVRSVNGFCLRRMFCSPQIPQKVYLLAKDAVLAMGFQETENDEAVVADLWMEVNRTFESKGSTILPAFPLRAHCKGLNKDEDCDVIVLSLLQIDMLLKTVQGRAFIGLSLFITTNMWWDQHGLTGPKRRTPTPENTSPKRRKIERTSLIAGTDQL